MDAETSRFREEIRTFESQLAGWTDAGQGGRWVVVRGGDWLGPFDTARSAWRAGIDAWGPGFLMRRVRDHTAPLIVSHLCFHNHEAKL
jgi:hypothetical protein